MYLTRITVAVYVYGFIGTSAQYIWKKTHQSNDPWIVQDTQYDTETESLSPCCHKEIVDEKQVVVCACPDEFCCNGLCCTSKCNAQNLCCDGEDCKADLHMHMLYSNNYVPVGVNRQQCMIRICEPGIDSVVCERLSTCRDGLHCKHDSGNGSDDTYCCRDEADVVCNGNCCAGTCCENGCCASICCGGQCCASDEVCCGSTCCKARNCYGNHTCCPSDFKYCGNQKCSQKCDSLVLCKDPFSIGECDLNSNEFDDTLSSSVDPEMTYKFFNVIYRTLRSDEEPDKYLRPTDPTSTLTAESFITYGQQSSQYVSFTTNRKVACQYALTYRSKGLRIAEIDANCARSICSHVDYYGEGSQLGVSLSMPAQWYAASSSLVLVSSCKNDILPEKCVNKVVDTTELSKYCALYAVNDEL